MMEETYLPPRGPPPHRMNVRASETYMPPPGPPPQHANRQSTETYMPPPGPPPSYVDVRSPLESARPQAHDRMTNEDLAADLQAPEDSAPPPNPFLVHAYLASGQNASKQDAERAAAFTAQNPLWPPQSLGTSERQALGMGYSGIVKPRELGRSREVWCCRPSVWAVNTKKPSGDACILSSTPLYSALHSPAHDSTMQFYFEVALLKRDSKDESGIAIGFAAQPYPTWRMPGHERGSLGVHSDDGRRYVNDSWGGRDFVAPFRVGDVLGVGMRFHQSAMNNRARLPAYGEHGQSKEERKQAPKNDSSIAGPPRPEELDPKVFFTRNGRLEASWDLHELVDADFDQPGGLQGLEGQHDLYAAVGIWGQVDVEIRYGRNNWMYVPPAT